MQEGLKKAAEIITDEIKIANKFNPIMAVGMARVRFLIENEIVTLKSQNITITEKLTDV